MIKSDNATAARPAVYPDEAGKVLVSDGSLTLTAAQNVDEAVFALCVLPAGCIPLDFTVIMGDLDSGASLTWIGGAINAAGDDVDQIMIPSSTVGQAAGVARASAFPIVAPLAAETLFGVHITAQTGGQAGTVRGILTYRSSEYGA